MYNENELSLTEATVLALQGKLKLEETKSARKRNNGLKKESVNISTDDLTVSTDEAGNTTVETAKETVTVTQNALDTDLPVIDEPIENETIDVPVEGDETIVPEEEVSEETIEDIIDEPEEDENTTIEDLELDESKKVENKNGFSKVKFESHKLTEDSDDELDWNVYDMCDEGTVCIGEYNDDGTPVYWVAINHPEQELGTYEVEGYATKEKAKEAAEEAIRLIRTYADANRLTMIFDNYRHPDVYREIAKRVRSEIKSEFDESKKVENKNGFSSKVKTENDDRFKANVALHSLKSDDVSKLMKDLDLALDDKNETEIKSITKKLKNLLTPNDYKSFIKTYYPEYKDVLEKAEESKKVCENCENCEESKCEENKECLTEEPVKYEWVLQGNYGYGWDDLVTYDSKEEAQEDYKTYREEEPEFAHRIRKRLIKEENKKESKEVKTEELNFNLSSAVYDELNLYLENIMSKIRDNLNEDTDSNYSEIINKIENSIVDNQLKDKLLDIVKFYSNKDKTTNISDYGSYLAECISSLRGFLKKNINKTEVKEVKTETKYTFNKKSFEEALTKFYNFNDERVKSFKVESIARNKKGSVKIEGKLNNKVSATMIFDKVTEGKSFITYKLKSTNNILKESKEIKTSMTVLKKENTLKCRSLISK